MQHRAEKGKLEGDGSWLANKDGRSIVEGCLTSSDASPLAYPNVARCTNKIHTPITLGIPRRTKPPVSKLPRRRPCGFDSHRPLHFSLAHVGLRCLGPRTRELDAHVAPLLRRPACRCEDPKAASAPPSDTTETPSARTRRSRSIPRRYRRTHRRPGPAESPYPRRRRRRR
jgi:hypothetical protein